jgi:hypothetical protein
VISALYKLVLNERSSDMKSIAAPN